MNKTIITALCIGTILISGCKENDITYYGEESRLEFSTYISCAFNDQNYFDAFIADEKITNVDFPVKVNLIGQLLTGERTFCLQWSQDEKTDYDIAIALENPYTFPVSTETTSAKISVACPDRNCISTAKSPRQGRASITFDAENSAHQFGLGREENLTGEVHVTLSIQPSTWSNEWWGSYSNSKYILMMECFKTTHDAIAKTQANQVKIRTYYTQYKREHGPLYGDDDESSTEISFPLNS